MNYNRTNPLSNLIGKLKTKLTGNHSAAGKETPIIVVSGLPRSGTSMMMKMLQVGGIPLMTDDIRQADDDNPKGYYEYERVKQLDKGDTAWLPAAQGKAVKVISILLKHLPAGHHYQIIFMVRNLDETLASQKQMLVNRNQAGEQGDDVQLKTLFEKHLQQVKAWLAQQPNMESLYINYNSLLEDPVAQIRRLNQFLGGQLDTEAMATVVDPDLYRQRV